MRLSRSCTASLRDTTPRLAQSGAARNHRAGRPQRGSVQLSRLLSRGLNSDKSPGQNPKTPSSQAESEIDTTPV